MTSGAQKIIADTHRNLSKTTRLALIIVAVDLPIAAYAFQQSWINSDSAILRNVYAFSGAIGMLGIIALGVFFSQKRTFVKYFVRSDKYLLQWKYPNGDEVIITYAGIIQHIQRKPAVVTETKFEGLSWGAENLKDLIEGASDGHFSITALIPAAKFSVKSNTLPQYIPFSDIKQIEIVYSNTPDAQKILMRLISSLKTKNRYTLILPLPTGQVLSENDFYLFVKTLSMKKPVRYGYLS